MSNKENLKKLLKKEILKPNHERPVAVAKPVVAPKQETAKSDTEAEKLVASIVNEIEALEDKVHLKSIRVSDKATTMADAIAKMIETKTFSKVYATTYIQTKLEYWLMKAINDDFNIAVLGFKEVNIQTPQEPVEVACKLFDTRALKSQKERRGLKLNHKKIEKLLSLYVGLAHLNGNAFLEANSHFLSHLIEREVSKEIEFYNIKYKAS
tara:strand:+ start:5395 stop:6024 length:630 start_codon:yes stop_codon:yes gene_type:complete